MALGSNAPRCAAGDCPEQLRFDFHQLHHERLLMVGGVLVVNPERWLSYKLQRFALCRRALLWGEIHQLHREGLLVVGRALIVSPRRWHNDG